MRPSPPAMTEAVEEDLTGDMRSAVGDRGSWRFSLLVEVLIAGGSVRRAEGEKIALKR